MHYYLTVSGRTFVIRDPSPNPVSLTAKPTPHSTDIPIPIAPLHRKGFCRQLPAIDVYNFSYECSSDNVFT